MLRRSAFFVFCSDHRPKIKEDNPGISIGDIAKKLGELWATQSAKDKAPYEAKAAKLKEKYEKVSRLRPGAATAHGQHADAALLCRTSPPTEPRGAPGRATPARRAAPAGPPPRRPCPSTMMTTTTMRKTRTTKKMTTKTTTSKARKGSDVCLASV